MGILWITLVPSLEELILTNTYWVIYISAVLYIGFIFLNLDIIVGFASKQLRIENSSVVDAISVTTTVMSIFTIIAYAPYSQFALADYEAKQLLEETTIDESIEPVENEDADSDAIEPVINNSAFNDD